MVGLTGQATAYWLAHPSDASMASCRGPPSTPGLAVCLTADGGRPALSDFPTSDRACLGQFQEIGAKVTSTL